MATLGRRKSRLSQFARAALFLLLAALSLQFILARPGTSPIRDGLSWVFSPFLRMGSAVHQRGESFWVGWFERDRLQRENEELRQRLAEVRLQTRREESQENLAALSQKASTNVPEGTYDLIAVSVLAAPDAGASQMAWISAGRRQGLEAGMIVLGAEGIVGEVEVVFDDTALVELVVDARSAWGAEVDGRGEQGIVRGTGNARQVEFHFSQTVAKAEVGDLIVSSGMAGSIAPGGIPFGKVIEIRRNRKGEPVALVELAEHPADLRTFFVLPHRRIPFTAPSATSGRKQ